MDAYVLKLNPQGNFIWAGSIGGTDADHSFDIAVDVNSNAYITGFFSRMTDFDPGPGVHLLNLYDDAVVVKLNGTGDFVFAAPFLPIGNGISQGRRLVSDAAQNVYVTGHFGGVVDFDPGASTFSLTSSANSSGIFVVKLAKCLGQTTATINLSSCNAYTLNNHTYDSSGTYTQVIPNSRNCDSIITLNLTINKKFTTQTKSICRGESFFVGGANQTSPGIYVDTLLSELGCDSIVSTTLIVNSLPVPDLGSHRNLCSDSSITITPGNFTSYIWQDLSTQSSFTINTSGLYWVTVVDGQNCSATDSIIVTSVSPPANFLKQTDSICSYETLRLQPLGSFQNYFWSTGSAQDNIDVGVAGDYWLRVSDANGCVGTDTISILPKQCMKGFYIPNAFTPNGDSKNDLFQPLLFGKVKKYQFIIYNRWGQIVFQTTEQFKAWDGKVGGIIQQTGVFVWTCTYQFEGEKQKIEKGTVTLIR